MVCCQGSQLFYDVLLSQIHEVVAEICPEKGGYQQPLVVKCRRVPGTGPSPAVSLTTKALIDAEQPQ